MNADGRREGDVAHIVRVIRTERAQLAWRYRKWPLTGTMLLKSTGRYHEGSRRLTVVVETSGLSGQPADDPNVVTRALIQTLIPPLIAAQPHPVNPSSRRREP